MYTTVAMATVINNSDNRASRDILPRCTGDITSKYDPDRAKYVI